MSDSVWPHRWQPTRLPHPWDSPGKNTGVDCHFLLQCMKVKSEREVAQSCLTLRDPMDCSLPGPPSMGFSRQEYWSGLPLPSPHLSLGCCYSPRAWSNGCCSVTKLYPTLHNPMDWSTLGFLVPHHLPSSCPLNPWCLLTISSCHPLLLLPSISPTIRVFSNESTVCFRWLKYWSFSISPSSEFSGLISFRIDWFDLLTVRGTLKSLLQRHSGCHCRTAACHPPLHLVHGPLGEAPLW